MSDDFTRAFRLWKRYKCDTAEYHQIAERLGIQTTELTRRCWQLNYERERAKATTPAAE